MTLTLTPPSEKEAASKAVAHKRKVLHTQETKVARAAYPVIGTLSHEPHRPNTPGRRFRASLRQFARSDNGPDTVCLCFYRSEFLLPP
jgi:hypothetical protein